MNIKVSLLFLVGIAHGSAVMDAAPSGTASFVSAKDLGRDSEDAAVAKEWTLPDGRRFIYLAVADGNGSHGKLFHDDVVAFANDIVWFFHDSLFDCLTAQ